MRLKLFFYTLTVLLTYMGPLEASEHTYILQSKFQTDTLFIQQASSATLKQNPSIPHQYELTLKGLYPRILYLTSRSKHYAGSINLKTFLKNWQHHEVMFKDEGPSAVMSYLNFKPTINAGVETDVLVLSRPLYNPSSNSLSFIAKANHTEPLKTGRFKNVVIVFDGLHVPKTQTFLEHQCFDQSLKEQSCTPEEAQ